MKITLNGATQNLHEELSITELVRDLQLDPRKIAIERNLCIVPANEYEETYLQEGDVLEVVEFIGGG